MNNGKYNLGVLTTSRSDFGLLRGLIDELNNEKNINLELFVTGSHKSKEMGSSLDEIKKLKNVKFTEIYQPNKSINSSTDINISMGSLINKFDKLIKESNITEIIILGDRYEALSVAIASLNRGVRIIHIAGGSVSNGSLDDSYRHMITKCSSLHLVETNQYKNRVMQLGEMKKNIHVIGSLSLNKKFIKHSKFELQKFLNIDDLSNFCILTFNPVTNEQNSGIEDLKALLNTLKNIEQKTLITFSNFDKNSNDFLNVMKSFDKKTDTFYLRNNLGIDKYFSILSLADYMIGNSSSGIIEAGSFKLPVINIGSRQEGRIRGANVIDIKMLTPDNIHKAIKKVQSKKFQENLRSAKNPYEKKDSVLRAKNIITKFLSESNPRPKKFIDLNL
tara:strand:- start:911 stop:2080 length:1170 start_codon:yes stop_codon:yes gene_type:complete